MKITSNSILSISPHSKLMRRILLLVCFISMFSYSGYSATYYSRVTGSFATLATWATDRAGLTANTTALAAGDIFIIQTGHNITLGANQTAATVTVESGGTFTIGSSRDLTAALTINAGGTLSLANRNLTQIGSLVNNGTISGTTGVLIMGSSTLTNGGSITFTTGGITRLSGGSLTNSGSITMGAGQFTTNSGAFTNEANGTLTITGVATVTLGTGDFVNNNTAAGSVNFGSSAVALTGTAQSIGSFTTTGAVTATNASGTITVAGNINAAAFTKSGAGTINMGSGTHTFTGAFALGTTVGSVVNGGSSTINVNVTSATAWNGTGTLFTAGTSTVNFGGVAQTISATGVSTFYNLTFSNSGVKTIVTANTTITNIFSLEGLATSSLAPTYGANATLQYNTATSRTVGAEWLATFAATGGVIIGNTGAITTNGSKVFNLDVPLTINNGATLSPATGNTFSFGGDLINNGTWTTSDGAVTIALARVTQSIGDFSTSGIVTMSKASGTATFTGNINGGAFTMNGAGTLNLGAGFTHTFTGAWTNTTGTLQGNTSTLNIGGTGSGTGVTFTANTSTVNFNGSVAQDIPTFTYYNLNTSTGNTKTLLGNTTVSNVLTINTSSTFATGAFTLTLSGTGTPLVDNGTFTATVGGTVIYSGATANIAAESYANLQTSTAGIKTLAGNTTVATVLTVNSLSTLETGANTLTLSGTGTPLVNNGTFTASAGSTVIFSGATATVAGETYVNLQASTVGAKTLGANTTVNGVLTINTGSTLALSSFTLSLTGTGTPLVNSGIFTAGTSTVDFSGSGAQDIPALTYYNLSTSTGDTKTLLGTITVSNVLTVGASTTLAAGANTINLSLTGTPMVVSGTFTAETSTVNFSNGGAQNIPALTYYNLTTSTGGTKTLQGTTTVSNVLTINATTTLAAGANTLNLSGTGTPIVNSGTFTAGTSTVNYNGSGAQNIPVLTYYNLSTSTGDTKTLQGTITVSNVLTVGASTTFAAGANTINLPLTGTPLVVSGTFTAGTSTVNFSNAGAQNIPALTYYNLTTSTGGTKTLQGTTTVSNVLTINAATTLAAGSNTLNLSGTGNPVVNSGTFTAGTGTVNFDGTTQTITTLTYYNLQTSTAGVKTLAAGTTVSNVLTINSPSTINLSTFTLTLSGSGTPLVNNGTFTASTSTVSFTSASSTNIPAVNFNNLNGTGGDRVFANSGTIGIAGTFTKGAGAYTVTGSTVDFNGLGAQTIPAFTFNDLVLSGSGAKTILTATTVTVFQLSIGNGPTLDLPGTSLINITKP